MNLAAAGHSALKGVRASVIDLVVPNVSVRPSPGEVTWTEKGPRLHTRTLAANIANIRFNIDGFSPETASKLRNSRMNLELYAYDAQTTGLSLKFRKGTRTETKKALANLLAANVGGLDTLEAEIFELRQSKAWRDQANRLTYNQPGFDERGLYFEFSNQAVVEISLLNEKGVRVGGISPVHYDLDHNLYGDAFTYDRLLRERLQRLSQVHWSFDRRFDLGQGSRINILFGHSLVKRGRPDVALMRLEALMKTLKLTNLFESRQRVSNETTDASQFFLTSAAFTRDRCKNSTRKQRLSE